MSKTILELFPNIKKIDDIDDLLEIAKTYNDEKFYFRGLCSNKFNLLPTLLRNIAKNSYSAYEIEYECNEEIHDCFSSGSDFISNLQIARHFGYKCRFLDITQSIWVALHFAFDDDEKTINDDKALICIDIEKYIANPLNRFDKSDNNNFKIYEMYEDYMKYGTNAIEEEDEDGNKSVYKFIYPIFCQCNTPNRRIEKQKGAFLMYADLVECDDEVQEHIAKHSVAYIIDKRLKEKIIRLCQEKDCNKKTMFDETADIDGLDDIEGFRVLIQNINNRLDPED